MISSQNLHSSRHNLRNSRFSRSGCPRWIPTSQRLTIQWVVSRRNSLRWNKTWALSQSATARWKLEWALPKVSLDLMRVLRGFYLGMLAAPQLPVPMTQGPWMKTETCGVPCGPKPMRTISVALGINEQIRIRFSSSRKLFFLNDSNFWCVQSSITHNAAVHVPVLWPVCDHAIPVRMMWCP